MTHPYCSYLKYIKILFNITIIYLILAITNPTAIFAQSETPTISPTPSLVLPTLSLSPDPIASPSSTVLPSSTPSPSQSPSPEILPTLAPFANSESRSLSSGSLKKSLEILRLGKSNYLSQEKVSTTIINGALAKINIDVKFDSKIIPFIINRKIVNDDLEIDLIPPRIFRPGKYSLDIIRDDGKIESQQFSWGSLNINFDKSLYQKSDSAKIGITVTDDSGIPVCDAHLSLTVTSPDNQEQSVLTTADNSISINPACRTHSIDQNPDYQANFVFNDIGIYKIDLESDSQSVRTKISDKITVLSEIPFQIERKIPQRIFTPEIYQSRIKITANTDFNGVVSETVPQELSIIAPLTGEKFTKVELQDSDDESSQSGQLQLATPLSGSFRMTQGFGENETDPILKKQYVLFGTVGHDGIDFAVPYNTPVLAADSGFVSHADWYPYGKTIILKHSWGQSYYGHLNSFAVLPDQYVTKGQFIGFSGSTGLSTGPHLHFGIRLNNFDLNNGYFGKVDPLLYLNNSINLSGTSLKNIIWNLNLKKGESKELSYAFNAPDVASIAYQIGPLKLKSESITNNLQEYSENRNFQILADTLPIKFMDFASGSQESPQGINSVSTDEDIIPAFNHLYLAVVSSKPNIPVEKVEGLSLKWTPVPALCENKSATNLNLFYALGILTDAEKVTAYFDINNGLPKGAAISVFRYSGIDPRGPMGNIICENHLDKISDLSVNTKTTRENSLIFSAISGDSNLNPGETFIKRGQIQSGINDNSVKYFIMDKSFNKITDGISVNADFDKPTTTNIVALEIIADSKKAVNRLRHGKWFDNQGSKHPFNL